MSEYTFSTILDTSFEDAKSQITEALKERGFGILTEIDIKATMKKKLDEEYPEYVILGACNPGFAHQALQAEPRIGTMLPCNVIVRALDQGGIEVSAVDPLASMQAIDNASLGKVALEVQQLLRETVAAISA